MKREKKHITTAERNAHRAVLRRRFFRAGLLSIAMIFLYFYSNTLDIKFVTFLVCTALGWIMWNSIPIVLLLLASACFSGYCLCGGNPDTRGADIAIVIMIMGVGGMLSFIWYAIAFVT